MFPSIKPSQLFALQINWLVSVRKIMVLNGFKNQNIEYAVDETQINIAKQEMKIEKINVAPA